MNICLAQIASIKGDLDQNILNHLKWIDTAAVKDSDVIVFPELSLTRYEPKTAKKLAVKQDDIRLDAIQYSSNENNLVICVGLPLLCDIGICISQFIFQPNKERLIYSKQLLHSDETPYFVPGKQPLLLQINDLKIAPAICYESLQSEHVDNAIELGAEIYIASVAKSQLGMEKAFVHFPKIAKQHSIPVLMVNTVGPSDNFISIGKSAVWDNEGKRISMLDKEKEQLLIFNTKTGQTEIVSPTLDSI